MVALATLVLGIDSGRAADAVGSGARAVLYEEGANGGKQYDGSVSWRAQMRSPGAGLPAQPSIRAAVKIPQRQMSVLLVLSRNTDSKLSASHIIEITFNRSTEIGQIPGILMKASPEARGNALKGVAEVKPTSFLVGLSLSGMQNNIELLKGLSWLEIPIIYKDGHRALLVVGKGEAGNHVFAKAFASWEK